MNVLVEERDDVSVGRKQDPMESHAGVVQTCQTSSHGGGGDELLP